jgi:phage-related protein
MEDYNPESDTETIRELYFTAEFTKFFEQLDDSVKSKFYYTMDLVRTIRVLSKNFVKHLENTELYEMRISVGNNAYRTILFAMDNRNVMLAQRILLLNGFIKKSTKDYNKQIKQAYKILKQYEDEDR